MDKYQETFQTIRNLIKTDSVSLGDALTHKIIMYKLHYDGFHEFPRKSLQAVCAHLRLERDGKTDNTDYFVVFCNKHFCQRIWKNLPI